MHPTQHMMESTHVWASTQTEEETTPTILQSTCKCKVKAALVFYSTMHSNKFLVEYSCDNMCCVTCSNTVPPQVQVTVTLTRVMVGNSTTLTCTVTRSNPMGSYTYRWVHNNSITLSETSSMLSTDMLNVNILMESNVGTYRCEVTNSAGLSGSTTTTIELRGE